VNAGNQDECQPASDPPSAKGHRADTDNGVASRAGHLPCSVARLPDRQRSAQPKVAAGNFPPADAGTDAPD